MSRISKKTLKQFNNLSFLCEEVLAEKLLDFVSSEWWTPMSSSTIEEKNLATIKQPILFVQEILARNGSNF